jgi:hypothetical protein
MEEGAGREDVAVLVGQKVIVGEELARELGEVGGQILHGVICGVAAEELAGGAEVAVIASLEEVLVDGLGEAEHVIGEAAAAGGAVGAGNFIEERTNGGVEEDDGLAGAVGSGEDTVAGVVVGDGGDDGAAEAIAEAFVGKEEEVLVLADGAAEAAAELVALEFGAAGGVKEVAGVEVVVAVEVVEAAVELVGAGLGERVDLSAGVAAELGGVVVHFDAKLANGLDAESGAGGRTGRAVGEVVLRGAIDEIDVGTGILAVDAHAEAVGNHGAAIAMRKGDDAGLEESEIGIVATVEGQVAHGGFRDEIAEIGGFGVYLRLRGDDGDLLFDGADGEFEVKAGGFVDSEFDPLLHEGAEAAGRGPDLYGAGMKGGKEVDALAVGDDLANQTAIEFSDGDFRAGNAGAGGIANGAGERCGGLGEKKLRSDESEKTDTGKQRKNP